MNAERRADLRWIWITAAFVLLAFAVIVWAVDRVTFQGERVLYSVQCSDGAWQQSVCTGRMRASDRYAFRASMRRQEVIMWVVGSPLRSHTFTECEVKSRDRWACAFPEAGAAGVKLEMAKGRTRCRPEAAAQPVFVVAKWKWYLLRIGLPVSSRATIAHVTCGPAQ